VSSVSTAAVIGSPPGADPVYQGVDEFVVGGVVTPVSVGQKAVLQT
jgi:hypothetical protein